MQKASAMLAVAGAVLALGMVLSFYGNHVLFENMAREEGSVSSGQDMTIQTELARADANGIYAIQIIDHDGTPVSVRVLDPHDGELRYDSVTDELFEGRFAIGADGTHTLAVTSDRADPVTVFVAIGPEPDAGTKSLGFISLYVLIVGLLGMAGAVIFVIIGRARA